MYGLCTWRKRFLHLLCKTVMCCKGCTAVLGFPILYLSIQKLFMQGMSLILSVDIYPISVWTYCFTSECWEFPFSSLMKIYTFTCTRYNVTVNVSIFSTLNLAYYVQCYVMRLFLILELQNWNYLKDEQLKHAEQTSRSMFIKSVWCFCIYLGFWTEINSLL